MRRYRSILPVCVIWAALAASATVAELPDSFVNPVSGNIEVVEAILQGSDYEIRHVENLGQGQLQSTWLTANGDDDRGARIAIESDGTAHVIYWRDLSVDEVRLRSYDPVNESWDSEREVSASAGGRAPALATDGTDTWTAFESDDGTLLDIIVATIEDDPDPFQLTEVGSTSHSSPATAVHAESGELWVTWVDSGTDVAWVTYDGATDSWSSVSLEDYSQDDVAAARARIRDEVLGL